MSKKNLEEIATLLYKHNKIAILLGSSYGLLSDEENIAYAMSSLLYILKDILKKDVAFFYLADFPSFSWNKNNISPYRVVGGRIHKVRYDTYDILESAVKQELKLLYIIDEDISSYPGVPKLLNKIRSNVELIIYQGSFLNSTSKLADLIIPTTYGLEKYIPQRKLKSNLFIFEELVKKFGSANTDKEDIEHSELYSKFSFRDSYRIKEPYPLFLVPSPYLFYCGSPWDKNEVLNNFLVKTPFCSIKNNDIKGKIKIISPFGELDGIEAKYSKDIPSSVVFLPYYFGAASLLPERQAPLFFSNTKVKISKE